MGRDKRKAVDILEKLSTEIEQGVTDGAFTCPSSAAAELLAYTYCKFSDDPSDEALFASLLLFSQDHVRFFVDAAHQRSEAINARVAH